MYISSIAILVPDYDEAIAYYTQILGFQLAENTKLTETKRWVRVIPGGGSECSLLLAKAISDEERAMIGRQCEGRVFLFLRTDNCERDYQILRKRGVEFLESPRYEEYGIVVVFRDLYGNKWDLVQLKT